MSIEAKVTENGVNVNVSGDTVSASVTASNPTATVSGGIGPSGPAGAQGAPGTNDYNELINVPSEFNPSQHAASHGVDGADPVAISTSQVDGLADELAAKLPLAGGAMANAATVTFSDGTNDSEIGGWGFGVETTGGSDYATVTATGVLVHGATTSTVITPASVAFGNGTSLTVGTNDLGIGGYAGISLNCAIGYELNWQAGHLRSIIPGGDGTPQTILCDSPMAFQAGATGISYDSLNDLPTLFSGDYGDLANLPTLFDGSYASLTNVPGTFSPSSHTHDDRYYTEAETDTLLAGKQAVGSYATLDGSGKVPSAQLPSYVDDVVETASTPTGTGEAGKIYVALDSGKVYRWSGSAYVEISPSPGSTDSVTEGATNLYFTNARATAAAPVQSVAGKTGTVTLAKGDVGLGNVDNTADASKPVSTAQAAADSAVASTAASDATTKANAAQAYAIQRTNHTGTQGANTITGLATVATTGAYSDLSGTPAAYSLPTASSTVTGGVRIGAGVNIDGTGVISVSTNYAAASHTHTASAISDSTTAGRALLTAADAAAQRTSLGLGTLATQSGTFSGTSSGTNTGDQTITLTGDVTGSGTGSFAATLASTAVTAGSFGSASSVATFTVDAKGRLTAAGSTAIAISSGAVSGLGSLATKSSVAWATDITGIPSTFAPSAHKSIHATGGADALLASDIGAAASSHSHGNITNAGAIGSTSGQIVVTTASGVLTTAATISAATQVSGLAASATTDATNAGNISAGTLNVARLPVTLEQSVAVGNSGASKTLSLASGSVQTVTLSASCTFTMPSAAAAATLTLILTQGSNYTAAFTGVKWPNGTAPTATTGANKIDVLTFVSDGTNWYGVAVQNLA